MEELESVKGNPIEFIVRLEGIELPDEVRSSINQQIQDVVSRNIAQLDLRKEPFDLLIDKRLWYGYFIRNVRRRDLFTMLDRNDIGGLKNILEPFRKI
jgi:hypothetical protein